MLWSKAASASSVPSVTEDWLYSLKYSSKACPYVYLCSRYRWLPLQKQWRKVDILHTPLIFSHSTDVDLEQIGSASVFIGWTRHSKACAELSISGGKLKVSAPQRRSRSGAIRHHHACHRREKQREKEWQEAMLTAISFPYVLSHPSRGGRSSTETMHSGGVYCSP